MTSRTDVEPLYYTPRDPTRKTLGRKVGQVLGAIDGPRHDGLRGPMPWQQFVLDVACEVDPATGLLYYRKVDVVVVRQAGKSSMTRAKMTHRALTSPGASILYTAQDRNHARRRLEKTLYEPLRRSPLGAQLLRPRWAAGSEAVRFANGAEFVIDAPTKKTSGHGETMPEAHLDEYFAARDLRLQQGVSPSLITIRGAQLWTLSAAGDTDSVPLWAKVEAGRARCRAGVHGRTAYFEYSAPIDADRSDPMTWAACHPAIGYTIDLEAIQAEHDSFDESNTPEEFDRAYLGWWSKAKPKPWVIPRGSWGETGLPGAEADPTGEPMWAVDVSPDRAWASIGMAATHAGVRCWLEVPAHEEHGPWVVPRLKGLAAELGGQVVAVDGSGPAAALIPDLIEAGFTVDKLSRQEVVDACGGLYDDVLAGYVLHDADPDLDTSLASAAKRSSGDAWLFVRTKSTDDISNLYALTLARAAFVKHAGVRYDPLDSIG